MDDLFVNKKFLLHKQELCLQNAATYMYNDHLFRRITVQNTSSGCPQTIARVGFSAAKRVTIRDLMGSVNKVMVGKYFLCRIIAPGFIMTGLHLVADDPESSLAVMLSLYNYTTTQLQVHKVIPVGTILAIKNPFFKTTAEGGFAVRSDNPAEVVTIEDTENLGVTWREPIPAQYQHMAIKISASDLGTEKKKTEAFANLNKKGHLSSTAQNPETADGWKSSGNKHFGEKNYCLAIRAYTSGLALEPKHVDLLSNRSQANLYLENFKESLKDAEAVLEIQPNHGKAIYRKVSSFIGLRKYEDAKSFMEGLTKQQNTKEIVELKSKLTQQLNGIYDMKYFLDNENDKTMKTYPNTAEFCLKMNITHIPGKGRGLVSTENIKAGQLIMVSKAFVFDEQIERDFTLYVNTDTNNITDPYSKKIMHQVGEKLIRDPELCEEFYSLYAGPEMGYLEGQCQDVDMERIDAIDRYNGFGSIPTTYGPMSEYFTGIWIKPSLINHSCINNNSHYIIKKDFMFIRASRDIKKGEEILTSYVYPFDSYQERRQEFQKRNFECKCDLCVLEKGESEAVHKARKRIMSEVKEFPDKVQLSQRQISSLKRYAKELARLRPNTEINFPLFLVEMKLSFALMASSDFMEAAKTLERNYENIVLYQPFDSIVIAVNCTAAYGAIGDKEQAMIWATKWKEQLKLVYGCDTVKMYENTKAFLVSIGLKF